MLDKFTEDIYKKILEYNSKADHNSIPHSDLFVKEINSLLGIDKPDIERIIKLLKESHKIFTFEITKEDLDNDIRKIDGYVECDLQTIRRLKNFFQKALMDEYEKQFSKRMLVHQIVKDIYARPKFYKNTILGQLGNKAIMLEEYENFMEHHYTEFIDAWKAKKLGELLAGTDNALIRDQKKGADEPAAAAAPQSAGAAQRAVDSAQYDDFSSEGNRQSLNKVLQIYGVEFFFRINLRKYNFDLLRRIIESGEIDRRADLTILKEMIQKMKSNVGKDPRLLDQMDKIYRLERIISRQMLYAH